MRKVAAAVFLFAAFSAAFSQSASEEAEENVPKSEEAEAEQPDPKQYYAMTQKGDQFLRLALTLLIPARPKNLSPVGGEGTIGYSQFLSGHFFVGGDLSFAFAATIGSNVLYLIPLTGRAGWQWSFGRFELPLSLSVGGAFENYLGRTYFGLAVKPEFAAFFRIRPEWSMGLSAGIWIMPQWYQETPENNRTGLFPDISITARYHF